MLRNAARVLATRAVRSSPRLFATPSFRSFGVPACPYSVSDARRLSVDKEYIAKLAASKPKIKGVFTDGAGSSGDDRGKGTKAAMTDVIGGHFKTFGIETIDPLKPIEEYNGEGKLSHFTKILLWLGEHDKNVKLRYQDNPELLKKDANDILFRLTKEGVKTIRDFSKPVVGFVEFAAMLKSKEIKLILQTAYGNAEADAFEAKMREHNVEFAYRVTSSDVKNPRDFPAMLHKCLDTLGLQPWEVVVLGDTPADMRAARGFWSIGLPDHSAFLPSRDLPSEEMYKAKMRVAEMLTNNGAEYVLLDSNWREPKSLTEKMSSTIAHIESRMENGYFPHMRWQAETPVPEVESKSEAAWYTYR